MKKVIFCLFILLPLFCSCQNKWQIVEYNGVSVQIPSDWGNKNTVNHYEEEYITEYQISAWGKDKTINTLTIQWIDIEIEGDLYIETIMEIQQERFPMYKQLQFSKIVDIDFLGFKAKKCHFYGNIMNDVSIEGEYIAFTKNECSYIIVICGDKNFYKSNDYNYVLNSVNPNFSETVPQKSNVKTAEANNNFTRYEFKNYYLSVPNTMELRDENSFMSLDEEIIKDKLKSIKKIDWNGANFTFQPAGTDDIQNLERQKKASNLYARILISYEKGKIDDFLRWNDDIRYTQAEYNELNKSFKDNLLAGLKEAKQMGMNTELLDINNIKIAKNANKFVYIKQQYIRKGLNGNVKVIDYYVFNNNEMVKLTISYRVSESDLWETDFNKIIDTFSFTTKK